MEPCIPYAWQFKDEDAFIPSSKAKGLSVFGLLKRDNDFRFRTTTGKVTSEFILKELDELAFSISKTTFVVLDNAALHKSAKFQEHRAAWEKRGLFIFYLPVYSPHLNIIEILWRKLKYEWLKPDNYTEPDKLFYSVTQALAAVGHSLKINFSLFTLS